MLTASVVTQSGPILLETFLKHYFSKKAGKSSVAREELLFDEAFVLVKTFLEISCKHTVEDLQKFGLTKTPSPPWVLQHRVLIPLNPSCSKAAEYLVQALGGPEYATKIAGGVKWWRVRMQAGVEGEWIGIKKDFEAEEVRRKERDEVERKRKGRRRMSIEGLRGKEKGAKEGEEREGSDDGLEGEFTPEMDHLRCILYIHGGAGYWGSINTHRYTIWRYARKMRGRCFAVNYRKAPQFPWPCALQDCLAAYLYLIDPPKHAKHRPVDPKNLIIAGDSAGGNLALSLLQVIRDVGLPTPAGGLLISPWGDLTHSFPSVLANTATDIVPPYGFIHRPSTLWPPPPPELTEKVQSGVRSKVKDAVHRLTGSNKALEEPSAAGKSEANELNTATTVPGPPPADEDTTARGDTVIEIEDEKHGPNAATLFPATERHPHHHPGPTNDKRDRRQSMSDPAANKHLISLEIDGKPVNIRSQIQLYCTNDQLSHPYVSPALGYLGGLPPLFVLAGDKEVLRDEIIYAAHKAADPEKYPVRDSVKKMLPQLKDCEGKYPPTQVHLQVYDGACHVLPMLSFTEPAKHCYRAIASWCKFVTSHHPVSKQSADLRTKAHSNMSQPSVSSTQYPSRQATLGTDARSAATTSTTASQTGLAPPILTPITIPDARESIPSTHSATSGPTSVSTFLPPSHSNQTASPAISIRNEEVQGLHPQSPAVTDWELTDNEASQPTTPSRETGPGDDDDEETSPANLQGEIKVPKNIPKGYAGNYDVYSSSNGGAFKNNMIRERVSVHGECRPLEDPSELSAFSIPLQEIGVVKEAQAERYLRGQKLWDEKYAKYAKRAEKHRQENLRKAELDAAKLEKEFKRKMQTEVKSDEPDSERQFIFDNEFSWTWALEGEQPPPSAVVGRRDTSEARKLANYADRLTDEKVQLGGLSLWTAMAGILAPNQAGAGPGKQSDSPAPSRQASSSGRHRIFGGLSKNKAD